jgi:hypothetical protein
LPGSALPNRAASGQVAAIVEPRQISATASGEVTRLDRGPLAFQRLMDKSDTASEV